MKLWQQLQVVVFLGIFFAVVTPAAAIPNSPSNLTLTFTGRTSFTLSWTDNAIGEQGYAVYFRVGNSGPFFVLASLPPSSTSLNVSSTTPGTTYQFVVVAYDADGDANSPLLEITTPGIVSRGTQLAVAGNSSRKSSRRTPTAGPTPSPSPARCRPA